MLTRALREARYRELDLWRGETLGAWFRARASEYANSVAICELAPGRPLIQLTYAELATAVEALAAGLSARGLRRGDKVVLQLPNGAHFLQWFLALVSLGAVPVLALPAHRKAELSEFIALTGAKALILAERDGATELRPLGTALADLHPSLSLLYFVGPDSQFPPPQGPVPALAEPAPSDVALLLLSGGSTGIPKLIPRTHDDYLYGARVGVQRCGWTAEDRYLAVLPMAHNFTLNSPGVLGALEVGATVLTASYGTAEWLLTTLRDQRVSWTALVPALAQALTEASRRTELTLPALTLQVGGARFEPARATELARTLRCRVQQVYGMAEGLVCYTDLSESTEQIASCQGQAGSVHDELRVIDPGTAVQVEAGQLGELQVRGPSSIGAYFGGISPESFTDDGYYRTADLVTLDHDGNVRVEGRLGERIHRGGEKFHPAEVERYLAEDPELAEVALLGLGDPTLAQRAVLCVVVADERRSPTLPELRRRLRGLGLAEYKLPDELRVFHSFPRTPVGKVDRAALTRLF